MAVTVADLERTLSVLQANYDGQRDWLVKQNSDPVYGNSSVPPEAMVTSGGNPILAPIMVAIANVQIAIAHLQR